MVSTAKQLTQLSVRYLLHCVIKHACDWIIPVPCIHETCKCQQLVLSVASRLSGIAQNRVASGVNVSCTVSLVRCQVVIILHFCVQEPEDVAGSTLLRILDMFALNNHDISQPVMITTDNIGTGTGIY